MSQCSNCGTQLSGKETSCPNCGLQQQTASNTVQNPKLKRKRLILRVILCIGCILLISIIAIVIYIVYKHNRDYNNDVGRNAIMSIKYVQEDYFDTYHKFATNYDILEQYKGFFTLTLYDDIIYYPMTQTTDPRTNKTCLIASVAHKSWNADLYTYNSCDEEHFYQVTSK